MNLPNHENDIFFFPSDPYYDDTLMSLETTEDIKLPLKNDPADFRRVGPPARGDFPGLYHFEISCSNNSEKKQYLYSPKTNTVYLNMMTDVPVDFKWKWQPLQHQELFVRATLILSDKDQQEARVFRCHNHRVEQEKSNIGVPKEIYAHVLRSTKANDANVFYCGSEENKQEWLNVVVLMDMSPPQGSDTLRNIYHFCCKHSCISGINRRKIEVIFTLENRRCEILGRRSMGFRVCSCPKRDMQKAESELLPSFDSGGPPAKKQKTQKKPQVPPLPGPADPKVYNLQFSVVGLNHCNHILVTAHNAMVAQISAMTRDDPMFEQCQISLAQIKSLLLQVKEVKEHD